MRRQLATMKALKQMLLMTVMLCILAVGAFAQKGRGGGDDQKKQDPPKVRVEDKKGPPPDNRQQNDNNRGGDKGGRP
jgi:hypothetical protein